MLIRGFMLDSARCLEKRTYYKAVIDFAAERGMNTLLWHFTDDQGCTLQFESVPGIGSPNAYTKGGMRKLIRYAKSKGIDLVPEVASLGHSLYITRLAEYAHLNESKTIFTGMCPVAEETREVLGKLIEEAATVFDSPNFHVGLDEANFGEHPLTAEALKTRTKGEMFGDHVEFIHSIVVGKLGRRMWMWGDGVLKYPEVARRVPRDVVMCNWQYRPEVPTESTKYLLDEGFDVVLCPALISHDQTLFSGEEFALPNVRCMKRHERVRGSKGTILGSVCTIWTGVRYMADALWPAMHVAAAVMREDRDVDQAEALCEFGRDFFGLEDVAAERAWSDACGRVMHLAPRRPEWLAVAKAKLPDGMTAEQVEAKGADWQRLAAVLRTLSPKVRRNRRAFRTFRLMVEVAAHWYAVAARLGMTDGPSQAELERMALKGAGLLSRVEGVWDQERFADDAKKYAPPVEFFRDDHLIPLLKQGLEALIGRLPAGWTGPATRVSVRAKGAAENKTFIG